MDIRKYKVKFTLVDPSKGKLNDPSREDIIKNVSLKDQSVKNVLDVSESYFVLEVHCENGTLAYFNSNFSKKLVNYDEFNELSIKRYGKRSLFRVGYESLFKNKGI